MKLNVPRFSQLSSAGGGPSAYLPNPALRGLLKAKSEVDERQLFARRFERYQTDPVAYIREVLRVEPWAGQNGKPGQLELVEAIAESIQAQLRGEPADQWFKVDAGHGVGKTFIAACLVNWFFDCFPCSVTYTTAPTKDQVELLLWKDIKALRPDDAPGEVLSVMLRQAPDWFAVGRTVSDAGGKGTERFQGQHAPFMLFVLDEGEGLPDFVFDATDAMTTGGVAIVLMFANPKTRTSKYYRTGMKPGVKKYRLSCLDHPNVVLGREVVHGATGRPWVEKKIADHCQEVGAHDEDAFTFEVSWRPGVIYMPDSEFLWRVMGIAPKSLSIQALVSPGRFEAAVNRKPEPQLSHRATMGLDCARDGVDFGTLYVRHDGRLWRAAQLYHQDSFQYAEAVRIEARKLAAAGVKELHIRVDGSGGYGSGPIDLLKKDAELRKLFERFQVFEVQFGSSPSKEGAEKYADLVTEMYAEANEALRGVAIPKPPPELEVDLTARLYDWQHSRGLTLKKLEPKDRFKKRVQRSPDDGDGAVLALAPDYLFNSSLKGLMALGNL